MLELSLTEPQLITRFVEALRELPQVKADLEPLKSNGEPNDRGYKPRVNLHVAGKSIVLPLETRKSVFPRDVHQVLWRLQETSPDRPAEQGEKPLTILIAESISTGAKELLRSKGVGYYDSGGSLYLPGPGAYIYIDKPPPKGLLKSMRPLFSGRRAQVLHALLKQPQNWFSVTDLALEAKVSHATASQVLTDMEGLDWLEVRGLGPSKQRQLREPAALLDAWAKQIITLRAPPLRRYFIPGTKADALVARIGQVFDEHQVQYALTHEAAAQHYAPFLSHISQVRVHLLIGPNADVAIAELGARVANEGANLGVIEVKSPDIFMFCQRISGLWIADPIQIYLDLLRGEGRSKEMADHFRKEMIGF